MKIYKKIICVLLSLAMVFGTMTVTAFADIEWVEVTTTAELKAAITEAEDGDTKFIKVTKRIGMTSTSYITIPEGTDIVIDTNGHSLGLSNKTANIAPITNNGTLTLQDSTGGGNVWGNSSGASAYPIVNNGILTIKDGVAVARYNGTVVNTNEDISTIGTPYAATAVKKECINNVGTLVIENATLCNGVTADGSITIQQGNFATDLSAYVEEGFEWQEGSTAFGCAYKSVKVSNAQALIGTTEYATLAEAFAAAVDGNTILLNKDVTVANRIELADAAEDAKKNINFNMNGKKVTYTGESNGFLLVRAYDTVNIYGEGTVDIQAGDFFFATNHYAKVNIEDGTFTGGKRLAYTSYGSSTMNISGGIWSIDPSNQMSTAETPVAYSGLADGYVAAPQVTTSETWLVKQAPSASLTVGGKTTEYASFDDAFIAAFKSGNSAVITVLKDTTSAGNIDTTGSESTAGVVLDLNGKTVSVTGTKFMKLFKSALTITDYTDEGKGKILGTASSIHNDGFIYANSSNAVITVEGGTIEANGEKAILRTGGSNTAGIVVNGGTIINKNETDPYTVVCATSTSYTPSVSINGGSFEGAMTVGSAGAFTISGGTFNFNPEELYEQGETVIINGDVNDNGDGTWTVIPRMSAKLFANGEEIGEYPTVEQAFGEGYKAYTDGDSITVSLIDDTTSAGNIDLSTKAVKDYESGAWTYNAPDITLDLNNHQLTVTGAQFLKLKAKFTIDDTSDDKGGILEATTSSVRSTGIIYLNGGRDFTINNGTVSATNLTDGQYLIDASGFQTPININGGTLDAGADGAFAIRTNNNGCVTTFTGGTILSPVLFDAGSGRATGGSFIADPTEWGITVEGIYIVDGPDDQDMYNVIIDPTADYIVEYNGKQYQTVAGAVADILATVPDKTGTITFITDAMIREGVINVDDADANITFDLNGRTIQEDSISQLFLLEKGNFAIKNGTILVAGQIATSGHIRANNANLRVKNIVFDGDKTQKDVLTNINSKNGGAFYIYGSDVTFDKTVIKNCQVEDLLSMTGNSGAIHIVKQSVDQVSNVEFINGSKIVNCQAAAHAGAVSVGSGCSFTLDEGCAIENCKATMGGAVYIDISDDMNFPAITDHLCGTAYINGDITNCTSTGDNSAPIASCGFVIIDDVLTTTGAVFQRQTVAAVDRVKFDPQLDTDMVIYVRVANSSGDATAPQLKVNIGDSEKWISASYYGGGIASFKIQDVNKAMTNNRIDVQVGDGADLFFSNPETILIEPSSFAKIKILKLPYHSQYVSKDIDLTGGKIEVEYASGEKKEIDMTKDMISGYDKTKAGQQTITVSYLGLKTSFQIMVNNCSSEKTKIKYDKWNVNKNEEVTLKISLENEENLKVLGMEVFIGSDFEIVEDKWILAKEPIISTFDIDKMKGVATYIENTYINNELFEIKLRANKDTTIDGISFVTIGKQKDNNGEKTTFVDLATTIPNQIQLISISRLPQKITYLEGKETFTSYGGKLLLKYISGETCEIDMKDSMVSGFDNTKVGKQTLTVAYEDFNTTFEIEIIEKSVTSMYIYSYPLKQNYYIGENIDVSGGKIKVYYNNGTNEIIDMTNDMISGFDSTKTGGKYVDVIYKGMSDWFYVYVEGLPGDADGNGVVDSDDACYLLSNTFFSYYFPLDWNLDWDFDNNGYIDSNDAIYLLMYTLFPDEYPLY